MLFPADADVSMAEETGNSKWIIHAFKLLLYKLPIIWVALFVMPDVFQVSEQAKSDSCLTWHHHHSTAPIVGLGQL